MQSSKSTSLDAYRLLGNSGLRVSPLCLGTMTFGNDWGWGADKEESQLVFNKYVELGGNFIDTANIYEEVQKSQLSLAARPLRCCSTGCPGRRPRSRFSVPAPSSTSKTTWVA